MDNMLSCGGTLRWLNGFFDTPVTGQIPALNAPERIFTSLILTKKDSVKIGRPSKRDAVTLKRHLQCGTVGWRGGKVSKQGHCKGLKQIRVLFVYFFLSDGLNELPELQSTSIIGAHDQRMCLSLTENFKNNDNKQFKEPRLWIDIVMPWVISCIYCRIKSSVIN